MKAFALVRPTSAAGASAALASGGSVALKASGIDLLDRLKERVDEPDRVVSLVDAKDLAAIESTPAGGLKIGALVTLHRLAEDATLRARFPSLAQAAGLAASPQLRRRATLGGNLGQHTRCGYYRHLSFPCVKRGAATCPVLADTGVQEMAAVFGNGLCASAHPSSVAPVLGALAALIHVQGPAGLRTVAFADLWAAPQAGRASDLALSPAEVIVGIELPAARGAVLDGYAEVRVKESFDWALVSAAVRLHVDGGQASPGSVWLGSVAPTPYRAVAAEALLKGPLTPALAERVGAAAAQGATPLAGNAYKVQLIKVAVKRALLAASGRR